MKNLLSLWVMALALVLLVGGSAMATIDPILDGGMDPTNGLDEGSQDGDHPWGGDQVPGVSGTESYVRPSRALISITIVPFDQLITDLVCSLFLDTREEPTVSVTSSSAVIEEKPTQYQSPARRARIIDKNKGVGR